MNRKDNWQALLMPVSEGFHNRVEETLEQIGKEAKSLQGHRKRTRALRSLAVALVAALLLAGTALVVGRLAGILDFASPRVEDETARQYIEHNLATAQNGRICLTVREGYYDGEVARTILEIAPVRMEDSIVLHDWWHYPNGEGFFAPGETDWQEGSTHSISPSLEKAALPPGADGAIAVVGESKNYTEDKAEDLTNCRATAVREGNAVVLYIEGRIHSYVGKVDLGYSVYTENGEAVSVRFTLKEEGVENVPMEFAAVEFYGLALQKVCVQYTPFAAFLQVTYAPALSGEAVAESGAYDPAGIYYGTEGGHYGHGVPDCQGMANATEWTGQELLDMGRPPCPVCVVPDSTKDKNSFLAQYGWTFDLLAADGQSLLDADSPWTRYNNASLYGQPEEWRTVSLPLRPDASLGGALSLEPYLAEDDIAIEAPRIPCWLAETAPVG